MMRRSWRAAAVCTAACLLLTGCAGETVVKKQHEQVVISLSWWGNDARNEYTIAAVEKFEELNPDIRVNVSYSEWSGYEARSRVQMVSDTEADVMQINFGWLAEYSPDGTGYYNIEDVADFVDLSNFSPEMLDYGRRGEALNAIPIAMNTETVYINKTLYEQYGLDIPETWEDLREAAKVMQADGIYPMSGLAKSIWLYAISYAEQVVGKTFLKEDGSLNFTVKELEVMLDFYDRMVAEKVFPQVEYYDRLNIEKGIYAGGVAWVSDAVNYFGSAQEKGYEIVIAPYTVTDDKKSGEGWYAKPATMYAISKHTEHPEEAAILLDFLLNSPEMAVLQGVEKGIPLSSAAQKTLKEKDMLSGLQYEASLCMEDNTELSQMNPFVENEDLIDKFTEACNLVLYEQATLEEAAKTLYNDIKAIASSE